MRTFKNSSLFFFFILYITFSCTEQLNSDKFESSDYGDFKIAFPEEPTDSVNDKSYIKERFVFCIPEKEDDNLFYQVAYKDYPNNMYHSDSLERIEIDLAYTQADMYTDYKYSITKEYYRSISGYPAMEFEFTSKNRLVRKLVVIVKNRVYELRVDTEPAKSFNKSIDRFLESFQLLNIKDNIPPFLNLPSEKELENPPFYVNYYGEPKREVTVMESLYGKTALIMEMNEINDINGDGIIALGVLYSHIPKDSLLTEDEMTDLINNSFSNMESTHQDYKLISSKDTVFKDLGARKVTSSYTIMGNKVRDIKISFLDEKNTFYTMLVLIRDNMPVDEKVDLFFNSFVLLDESMR